MTEILTKDYIDERLGSRVKFNGENYIVGYEHNVGRLALWSSDGNSLRRFLKQGDVIQFEDGIERLFEEEIRE